MLHLLYFVLIDYVLNYYMVCLITVSIDYKKIMNTAVHILYGLPKSHHNTDAFMELHWLPIL